MDVSLHHTYFIKHLVRVTEKELIQGQTSTCQKFLHPRATTCSTIDPENLGGSTPTVRPKTKRLGGTLKPERRKQETEAENSSCRGRNLSTRNQVRPSGKHKTLAQPRLWHEQKPDSRSKRACRTGDAKDHPGQNPRQETGARAKSRASSATGIRR
jgi:hypothetical protein